MKPISKTKLLMISAATIATGLLLAAITAYIEHQKNEAESGFNTEVPEPSAPSTDIRTSDTTYDTINPSNTNHPSDTLNTADTAAQSVLRTLSDFQKEIVEPSKPTEAPVHSYSYTPSYRSAPSYSNTPSHSAISAETEKADSVKETVKPRSFIGTGCQEHKNEVIEACIHEDQKIRSGDRVRIRITADCTIEGAEVRAGTIVTGIAEISGNRVKIRVRNIRTADRIIGTDLTVMDNDNCEGIFYPELESEKAARGTGSSLVRSVATTLGAGGSIAGRVVEGGSGYLSEKLENVPIRLYGNHKITLVRK